MAGFFGLFDYTKPGKGVNKSEPQKKRFFFFFELYFRKFWKIITLNLIYLLFCLPIVTIGPATAALMKICKEMSNEKGIFLWSDFVEAFKKNFKQGFAMGIIDLVFAFLLACCLWFYYHQAIAQDSLFYYILLGVAISALLIVIMMNYYVFLMIPVLDMKLGAMIKNSFIMVAMGIKTNLCTLFFTILLSILVWGIYPLITIIGCLTIFFATYGFIVAFNSYQYIEKYIIQPYYERTGEKRPDVYYPEDDDIDEFIFEDIGTQEKPAAKPAINGNRGKTIK